LENVKTILIILDGWGLEKNDKISAISQAKTPVMDALISEYSHSELITYGEKVGLPSGQMGNSEVGHLNIGAGRVIYQQLLRINNAIEDGSFNEREAFLKAINYAKDNNKAFHLMGLVSDGGIHSHINHIKATIDLLAEHKVDDVYIHAFMDGRDTDPKGGHGYLEELQDYIKDGSAQIISAVGRYYAMDRDNRWPRIKEAYDLLIQGKGETSTDILNSIKDSYKSEVTDEFIKPIIKVDENGNPIKTIEEDEVVLFFNFRTDRPRQLTTVLTQKDLPEEGMKTVPLYYLTMTEYSEAFQGLHVVFNTEDIQNTLGETISKAGKTQLRIAETEKYPHVTFFFNGGEEKAFAGESRILVPSPKVATYDLQPEMSAEEVSSKMIAFMESDTPDFICLNFANTDMAGHTGDFQAAVKAAETVDSKLGEIIEACQKLDYVPIIIADHGNADIMVKENGDPHTAHTTNPVPIVLAHKDYSVKSGKLADLAPSILGLMGIAVPREMTGDNIIDKI